MKKFEVYRNIRKKAMIFGLPLHLFALQMLSIIGSLMVIIFSFSFLVIISVLIGNAVLFIALTRISSNPQGSHFGKIFPKIISNKRSTTLNYEEDQP